MTFNVMLIDDDEAAHTYHKIMMDEAGWSTSQIISRYDVQEAINYLRELNHLKMIDKWPEYIFVDLNMPVKSGYDFIDDLKKINLTLPLPTIFFVSSTKNPTDIDRVKDMKEIKGFKTKFLERDFFESLIQERRI